MNGTPCPSWHSPSGITRLGSPTGLPLCTSSCSSCSQEPQLPKWQGGEEGGGRRWGGMLGKKTRQSEIY